MVVSYLRTIAAVSVLAIGLLMGGAGGAIAVADPGSTGSTAHAPDGAGSSSQGSSPAAGTASNPAHRVTETWRKTVQHVTSTFGSGRRPVERPPFGAKTPRIEIEPGSTDTKDQTKDSGLVPPAPNAVPEPSPVAQERNAVAREPSPVAQERNGVAPDSSPVAPVPNAVAPVPSLTEPVPHGPTSIENLLTPIQDVVAQIHNVVAPVSDVVVAIRDMLFSVANGVVPLMQLPCDLSCLFGITTSEPVVNGAGRIDGAGPSPAADPSMLAAPSGTSQSPLVRPLAGIYGAPVAGKATPKLGGSATTPMGHQSLLAADAPLARKGASPPRGVPLFVRQAIREFVRSPSLWALAAVALPGVGGLVILTAAGVRIGYRQANAAFALHTAGIARWARPGPLGVVRSGSVVTVRPRAPSAECLLDKAA